MKIEAPNAHDRRTAVEDAGGRQREAQVMGDVVEQAGPRGEDGRVDDEQVLVDQAGYVGQRTEGRRAEGRNDVRRPLAP